MISIEQLREIAFSFPQTTEDPHFEKTSFRVKKKIFATYDPRERKACLKFSDIDQDVFSAGSPAIYPVPNKWGKQGWTIIELDQVNDELFIDAIRTAYCQVAPEALASQVRLI